MFPPTSRYAAVELAAYTTVEGRDVTYLRRRFLPPIDAAPTLAEHSVAEGERLDNVTAKYLGDPEQFWRLCDANDTVHPQELTAEPGRRLRVPMPTGQGR